MTELRANFPTKEQAIELVLTLIRNLPGLIASIYIPEIDPALRVSLGHPSSGVTVIDEVFSPILTARDFYNMVISN